MPATMSPTKPKELAEAKDELANLTPEGLRQRLDAHLKRAGVITSAAEREGRGLSDDEKQEADEIVELAGHARSIIEMRSQGITVHTGGGRITPSQPILEPRDMPDRTRTTGTPTTEWRDSKTGEAVHCLSREVRMTSLLRDERPLSLGKVCRAMAIGGWRGDDEAEQRAMATNVNTAGGYLVPDPIGFPIIDLARNLSVLFKLGAQTIPMTSDSLSLVKVITDPTFAQHPESGTIAASDISLGQIQFTSHTITARIVASRELAEDAPNFSQMVEQTLAQSLAVEIDRLGLVADGSTEPLGVTKLAGVKVNAVGAPIDWGLIFDAVEDMMDVNAGEVNGIVTVPALAIALRKLLVNSEANHYAATPPSLANVPVVGTNQALTAEVYVADWTQVMVGLRSSPRIEMTTEGDNAFSKHEVHFKVTWRGDFNSAHSNHLVKLTGATV